jgi:hypothetical protein
VQESTRKGPSSWWRGCQWVQDKPLSVKRLGIIARVVFFGCNLLDIKLAGWVQAEQFFKVSFLSSSVMLVYRQKLDYRLCKSRGFEALLLSTMFRNAQWYHMGFLHCFAYGFFLHFLHALFPHRSCFPIFQVGSRTLKLTSYCLGEEENQQ